jgi:thioesterase domain-containing protein
MQYSPILDGFKYLRPIRTTGTRPPLFCFFPGMPGASDLADSLPDDQPVFQFFYPNLDELSQFPAVEALASDYISDIRKIQLHGPYQLCGYSKGGLLAYEAARLLCAQGESVSFLALLETWHPRFVQDLKFFESVQYHGLYAVDRTTKYCADLMSGDFGNFGARVAEAVTRRIAMMGWRAARVFFKSSSHPVPRKMQETESTAVLKAYVPKPYANRLFLVRTNDKFEMGLGDQTFGWQKCVTGGVEIFFVQGNHGTMKDKPYVKSLADRITPYLATTFCQTEGVHIQRQ